MVTEFDIEAFKFRGLHPHIFLGTASDRYAGWIGKIYSKGKYEGHIHKRSKTVGKNTFTEETLPVESLEEYFDHFAILEIDFTFYRFLVDDQGKPTQNYYLLQQYGRHVHKGDFLFLKVPQVITARRLMRGNQFSENNSYLNVEIFTRQFYEPAQEILGPKIRGFIFEQEYHRKQERLEPQEEALNLDRFFESIPRDNRFHLELRTEAYLRQPVFEVLEKYGVGQVLSHWTWLPSLWRQFNLADQRFFNRERNVLLRLMTPRGMRYEEAYEKAFPFDRMVEGLLQAQMLEDTVKLMRRGLEEDQHLNVIINNRSGGSAPLIAQELASRFLTGEKGP
jgi:uncharacterized protein YecE (DUF72 family)